MNEHVLSVADKDILFTTDMDAIKQTRYFKQGTNPSLKLIWIRSTHKNMVDRGIARFVQSDKQYPLEHQCMMYRETRDSIGIHPMTMMLAYLTGINSAKYDSIHGCGMIVKADKKERGILVIGRGGAGKSSLGRALGNGNTLDDDILLIDNKTMHTVGIYGAVTYDINGEKLRKHQEKGISEASIDAIFLLDKQHDGGYIKELEWNIPRTHSVFDTMESELREIYTSRPSIKVDVPVYALGTHNDIHMTKKNILSVL